MIDDELLQELLAKASGLYNNGDYRSAIEAWKEVLQADPSSQKAREGIQMATLLLGDFDPQAPAAPDPAAAADGAPAIASLPRAERASRLDEGLRRVRALLVQRKFGEAVEGARSLVPIDPTSEEVQRLIDEAQQAFEAAPFIEEHLTLAKELATEERWDEAVAECRKIFTLDPANPDGHALMTELKKRVGAAETAASGGATMRIGRDELAAMQAAAGAGAAAEEIAFEAAPEAGQEPGGVEAGGMPIAEPEAAPDEADAAQAAPEGGAELPDQIPDDLMNLDFDDAAATPAAPEQAAVPEAVASAIVPPPSGAGEAEPFVGADLAAELGLEEEPAASSAGAAGDEPVEAEALEAVPELPGEGETEIEAPQAAFPVPEAAAEADATAPADPVEEVVEAQTVVAPAVRRVPRDAKSPSVEDFLNEAEDAPSIPLAKPVAPAPPAAKASPTSYAKTPDPGWEEELESLNLKSGEHDLVGHAASRNPTAAGESGDVDLSSLLGDELGDLQAGGSNAAAEPPPAGPGRAPTGSAAAPKPAAEPPLADEPAPTVDALLEATSPRLATEPSPRKRVRISIPPMMFAGLGVVILAAAAGVWWFVYQPKSAAAQVASPPAGNPPAARVPFDRSGGPIPTPMASTSRQPAQPADSGSGGAEAPDAGAAAPAPATGAAAITVVDGAAPGALPTGTARAGTAPTGAAAQGAVPNGAQAPAPRPVRSAEEIRVEVAQRMSNGRRFQSESKWQEARAEYAAALALDPVNFQCKELLDQMQAKVDEDTKVRAGLEEAKRAFADKDYQGALWKLYRLPRDPRLGDIDLYIRNAWFNWAIVGLKGGDATDAKQKLNETLGADPDDADAHKLMDVAEKYSARAKDRVYYSFVDTLRYRAFDQK